MHFEIDRHATAVYGSICESVFRPTNPSLPVPLSAMPLVVVEKLLPKMDASSAVFPTVRVVEKSLVVAFHLHGCRSSAVVRFNDVRNWSYGSPNDEGLAEHPFWDHGLKFYEFHRGPIDGTGMPSWIATFHDGTLTVEAATVEVLCDSVALKPWDAIDKIFGVGPNRTLDD